MAERPDIEDIRFRYRHDQETRVDMGHLLRWVAALETELTTTAQRAEKAEALVKQMAGERLGTELLAEKGQD